MTFTRSGSSRLSCLAAMAILILTACTDQPEASFGKGCERMMKRQNKVTEGERIVFCNCLTEKTASLSAQDRLTLGQLMTSTSGGQALRTGIEEAHARDEVSKDGAAHFLTTSMRCSVEMVL